ncbi:MAG: methyl-accepting chemotaxis protein [Clostridia bacterium]|nr:methyl-accepting chemotaxis protein [Clostridia bacterium]
MARGKISFKAKIVFIMVIVVIAMFVMLCLAANSVGTEAAQSSILVQVEEEAKLIKHAFETEFPDMYFEDDVLYLEEDEDITKFENEILAIGAGINTDYTIFAAEGSDFKRMVTTLVGADGKKMTGTTLGSGHAAFKDVSNGKSFVGPATINNKPYLTAYETIVKDGKTIALVFCGCDYTTAQGTIDASVWSVLPIDIIIAVILVAAAMWLVLWVIKKDLTERITAATELLGTATEKVDGFAQSIADSGASFAQDSQEQASSIEEVSASIEETTSMIAQTSEGANQTSILTQSLSEVVSGGEMSMNEMSETINDIKQSSDEIGKIIKVIDDIASQTNILALNAAVEAARAGDAGKGFAVVAEEVRNLAQKSAEAAKSSASIIEKNINLSETGVDMAGKVSASFAEIAEGVEKVKSIAKESAEANSEEAKGMEQISESMKVIENATMGTAEKAQQNVEYSRSLQSEMSNVISAIDQLKSILGQ